MDIEHFLQKSMKRSARFVPARLQAALALLEKMRTETSLALEDHLLGRRKTSLKSHETWGKKAHERWKIQAINKNHGRRSSNLMSWGQQLLDILRDEGFAESRPAQRGHVIDKAQEAIAACLRGILEQQPLQVRLGGRSAEAVIREVLRLAEEKGKVGDVAQYLVGAKLKLRFKRDIPVLAANKGDRSGLTDPGARLGDFQVSDAVIEVAIGLPDEKHVEQVANALEVSDHEFWLLTRADRVDIWKKELDTCEGLDTCRAVVAAVEAFIGQNITELAGFSTDEKRTNLRALFDIYNTEWIEKLGPKGLRIEIR